MKRLLAHFAIFAAMGLAALLAVVLGGLYDISATDQHLAPTYRLLDYAMSLAQEPRARLLLLHAIEWPPERAMSGADEREIEGLRAAARRTLHALVPEEARAWCETEEMATLGRAHEEIVRIARERDADLIVLGVY